MTILLRAKTIHRLVPLRASGEVVQSGSYGFSIINELMTVAMPFENKNPEPIFWAEPL